MIRANIKKGKKKRWFNNPSATWHIYSNCKLFTTPEVVIGENVWMRNST